MDKFEKNSFESETGFILSDLKSGTSGRNGHHSTIANIKWFNLKIENKKLMSNYSYVNLIFFKIKDEHIDEARGKNAIFKAEEKVNNLPKHKIIDGIDYKMSSYENAHIDGDSGNIHPGEKYVGGFNLDKIRQLVLCSKTGSDAGPKCNCNDYNEDNSYIFDNFHIHKACFYPLINKNDKIHIKDDLRYKYLEEIWNEIPDKFKEEID